jgi:hypothetical protein
VTNVTTLATTDFNGVTGSVANLPADFGGKEPEDVEIAGTHVPAPPADLNGGAMGHAAFSAEMGGNVAEHIAAMHNLASLAGAEFYF